ncbi:MAG TPA: lipoprotein [Burkholderiaceae bacterium]|nr:lipoprotein [Burkholderiaceae bacterium]
MQLRATILAAGIAVALSSCGQKGPLTLPVPPTAQPSKTPAKSVDRPFPDVPATSEQK